MCFALTNPELVDRLIVVDSFPGTSVATGAAVQCLKAMMQLNVKAIKSQAEANEALKSGIKVGIFEQASKQFYLFTQARILAAIKVMWARCTEAWPSRCSKYQFTNEHLG